MVGPADNMTERSMPGTVAFEAWSEISRVETDRFCFKCGYNLHQQSVRREPRTEVLLSRCPECGTFHPAAVPATELSKWVQRFKSLLVVSWVLVVLWLGFMVGFLHAVAMYFTLDEFTGYYSVAAGTYVQGLKPYYLAHPEMWTLVCGISGSSSFGLAFVGTTLALVFLPHWRKAAHVAVIFVWALLPALIVALIFREEVLRFAPHLVSWSVPYIAAYAGCYLAGGGLALLVGRGLVRLCVRICVPPRWRVHLESIRPA